MTEKYYGYFKRSDQTKASILLSIQDDCDWLTVNAERSDGSKFSISFEAPVFYMKSDEGDRLPILPLLVKLNKEIFDIYTVSESELLDWFKKQSYGAANDITHFCITLENEIIDVLSFDPPRIESMDGLSETV